MSSMRVGLLVVGVVLGGLIIANAFPGAGAPGPAAHGTSSPSARPTTTGSPHPSPAPGPACGSPQGVKIAVENAAGTATLASVTAAKLKAAGYVVPTPTDVSNASTIQSTTTVFYRTPADKHAAACMKKNFFPKATLKPMSAGGTSAHPAFSKSAMVAVFLGQDYAATHPGH